MRIVVDVINVSKKFGFGDQTENVLDKFCMKIPDGKM